MNTKSKAFEPLAEYNGPEGAGLAAISNGLGWELVAYRIDFHGETLEFVQFNHPDGTTSYMRLSDDVFCAGPFGGGMSWTLPKYVIQAGEKLARETFIKEEVPA